MTKETGEERPTVTVLGRDRKSNMPSLTRMLEILKPVPVDQVPPHLLSGMDVAPAGSVRICGRVDPMMGEGTATCPDCLGPAHSGPCPRPKR